MLKNYTGIAQVAKQVKKNVRMPLRWMFPSGVNYYAIADRAQHDAFPSHDQLKWMVPSGVNYKPNSAVSIVGLSSSSSTVRLFSSKNKLD